MYHPKLYNWHIFVYSFLVSRQKNLYLSCVVNEQINVPMVYLKMYTSLGVHERLHIYPLFGMYYFPCHRHQIEGTNFFYCFFRNTHVKWVSGKQNCPQVFVWKRKNAYCAYRGVAEARILYAIVVILFINSVYNLCIALSKHHHRHHDKAMEATSSAWSRFYMDTLLEWTLVYLLLVRTNNISLVALVVIQRACLARALREVMWMSSLHLALLHVWFGQAAFFYQVGRATFLQLQQIARIHI